MINQVCSWAQWCKWEHRPCIWIIFKFQKYQWWWIIFEEKTWQCICIWIRKILFVHVFVFELKSGKAKYLNLICICCICIWSQHVYLDPTLHWLHCYHGYRVRWRCVGTTEEGKWIEDEKKKLKTTSRWTRQRTR